MKNINFDIKKALHYEDLARKAIFGYDQLFIMVSAMLSDKRNDPANVLVVGSGTGMELTTFGSLMPNWQLTGVDPSEEMIKISREKIMNYGLQDRVKLHKGVIENFPEDEKFDIASLIFVTRFIPDDGSKLLLFQNIYKRLEPKSKLIIIDQFGDQFDAQFQKMVRAWYNFMKFRGIPPELTNNIIMQAFEHSLITESRLRILLREAGFEIITCFYKNLLHSGWLVIKN